MLKPMPTPGDRGLKFTLMLLLVALTLAVSFMPALAAADTRAGEVSTRRDFTRALSEKQSVIYVNDIDFGLSGGQIELTYDVTVIGREGGSVFNGAFFLIHGGGVNEELITVRFENIVFDGGYDTAAVVFPAEGEGFGELFGGKREEYRCVNCEGYVDLSFWNCEFTRYVAFAGPVMYLRYTDGNVDLQQRATLRMDNCLVYGNVAEKGTIWVNGANTQGRISNCRFYENTARGAAGLFLGGMDVEIADCVIENNRYYAYYPAEEDNYLRAFYGGGLYAANCTLRLTGTRIDNNRADWGGGVILTGTSAWIENCRICANSAEQDGGGLYIYTRETLPTYMTNTLIAANAAERGGAFFVSLSDARKREIPAGLIELSFSTIGRNAAQDGTHLWYDDTMTAGGVRGTLDLFGCFVLDDSLPEQRPEAPDYNYVAADALSRGTATREQINFPATMGLRPTPGGEADVTVPAAAMRAWAQGAYADIPGGRKIGWSGQAVSAAATEPPSAPGQNQPDNPESAAANPLIFVVLTAILLGAAGVAFYLARKRQTAAGRARRSDIDAMLRVGSEDAADDDISENGDDEEPESTEPPVFTSEKLDAFRQAITTLTRAQRDVFDQYVQGHTPKEAADILSLSMPTIRSHNTKIREKLGVTSLEEMKFYLKWMNEGDGGEK